MRYMCWSSADRCSDSSKAHWIETGRPPKFAKSRPKSVLASRRDTCIAHMRHRQQNFFIRRRNRLYNGFVSAANNRSAFVSHFGAGRVAGTDQYPLHLTFTRNAVGSGEVRLRSAERRKRYIAHVMSRSRLSFVSGLCLVRLHSCWAVFRDKRLARAP